jgi:hypothetical protein
MYLFLLLYIFLSINSLKRSLKPKFCINCKHYIQGETNNKEYGKCSLFVKDDPRFLVDGVVRTDNYRYCSTARSYDHLCGVNATKYEKIKKYKKEQT